MKRIEFGELRIGDIAKNHLMDICDRNWASAGPLVRLFEEKWGKLFGYDHNVSMSSGTDACINACLALYDLRAAKRGVSEVIVPALSFVASPNAIRAAGLVPVFVDINRSTLNIDENLIEDAITENTVAIMPVHTMGKPCSLDVICDIANRHDLIVIEDCCEAHGARYNNAFVGNWGNIAAFSFYIAHIVVSGEGGMCSCRDDDIRDLLRSTRSHGRPFGSLYFNHQRTGLNSKMNDMEAALGLESVENFWATFSKRHSNMLAIRKALVGFEDEAWFSEQDDGNINCPHGFSVTCKKAGLIEKVKEALNKYNIHHKRNFGSNPTQQPVFADMGYKLYDFPEAEWVGDNGIHIGCHQYLSEADLDRIVKALKEGLSRGE